MLRTSALFILVLLLLNPVFRLETSSHKKRSIAVLLDNSKSMGLNKGIYHGLSTYDSVLSRLVQIDTNTVHIDYFTFGSELKPERHPRLTLSESATDLSRPLNAIFNSDTSYSAIILLTDGIYNNGEDPEFIKKSLPIDVVGLGDTTRLPDVLVQDLSAPGSAYKGANVSVTASIAHSGYTNRSIPVQLFHGNRLVTQKEIRLAGSRGITDITFNIRPIDTGIQSYRIHIPKQVHESNTRNNDRPFHINIQNNRIRVAHLAFEVHPDVGTVRTILHGDPHIQLATLNIISKSGSPLPSDLPAPDSTDAVILQGFPQKGSSPATVKQILEWSAGKPLMLITTPNTDLQKLNTAFEGMLPLKSGMGRWQPLDEFHITDKTDLASVTDHITFHSETIPENIYAWQGVLDPSTGAQILITARLSHNSRAIPVVAVRKSANRRISELLLTGFYRLNQSTDAENRHSLQRLITQLLTWTASNPKGKLLQLKPVHSDFTDADNILFNAEMQDQSGQPTDKAHIRVSISGNSQSSTFDMTSKGDGRYDLNIGKLGEGIYRYRATARLGEAKLDSSKGTFSVTATNLEYVNTSRNDPLLRSLARKSGGYYMPFKEIGSLKDSLKKAGLLEPLTVTNHTDILLYRYPWWLLLVVILLSAEWILRRKHTLP